MQKLFLFLLVLLGIWYVRRLARRGDSAPARRQPAAERPAEHVHECRLCGVLVPESEGQKVDGEFFCSPEHARDYANGRQG